MDRSRLPRKARQIIAQQRVRNTEFEVTAKVGVADYGWLCAGAKLHGLSGREELLREYIYATLIEWNNDGYGLD